jgi:predicted DNA-binding protein (UPF0251 family)
MLKPNPRRFFRFTCNDKYSQKDIDRFIRYIKIDNKTGCFIWSGKINNSNYGVFKYCKNNTPKSMMAHRVAFEISTGILIPDGKIVMHKCDNPPCCNPDHLKLGTNLDNIEDRNNKGRQASGKRIIENRKTASGEKSGMSKLTWKEIYEIRHKHDYENITQDKLSEIFKVSQSTILCIIKNKTWHDSNYTPQKSRLGRNQIG